VLSTWGYNLSHRLGVELLGLLEQGAKGPIHAVVKTTEYDAGMQAPTSVIRGDGYSQLEIAVVGHLFEHIGKQGALDDASGSAVALEMARAWVQWIRDGAVPRPHRTIRFLWVDGLRGHALIWNATLKKPKIWWRPQPRTWSERTSPRIGAVCNSS
jgi:hypothetical protein